MNGFLDIYVKLIIAIISFIAPLIVYLLSVFSEGTAILTRKAKEYEMQIANLLRVEMEGVGAGQSFDPKIIEENSRLLKENEKEYTKRLNLLNPHIQLVRIFIPLLSALGFVMADMLTKDPAFKIYNQYVSMGLILLSFTCFYYGIKFLRQVSKEIIDTKHMIAKDKAAVSVGAIGG